MFEWKEQTFLVAILFGVIMGMENNLPRIGIWLQMKGKSRFSMEVTFFHLVPVLCGVLLIACLAQIIFTASTPTQAYWFLVEGLLLGLVINGISNTLLDERLPRVKPLMLRTLEELLRIIDGLEISDVNIREDDLPSGVSTVFDARVNKYPFWFVLSGTMDKNHQEVQRVRETVSLIMKKATINHGTPYRNK